MTIRLPEEWERFVRDEVRAGRYRSEEDVIREALARLKRTEATVAFHPAADPVLDSMRDAADELDEVVEEAMDRRQSVGGPPPAAVPAWQRIIENMKAVPDEVFDRIPADSSAQLDHYLYGTPKRPTG